MMIPLALRGRVGLRFVLSYVHLFLQSTLMTAITGGCGNDVLEF